LGTIEHGPWPHEQFVPREKPIEPFQPWSPARWQGQTPPPHDWIVDGCFLKGSVSILAGDGGLGKSLVCQQLCTAGALGIDWLGMGVTRCKTFFLGCEDDVDELHRRQANINRRYDCEMGDLGDMLMIERVGRDNAIMDFDRRNDDGKPTLLYEQIRATLIDHGAQIAVFDTVADVFSGNEIVRNQVRRFITHLRRLAIELQGAVILTAHPSNEGMASGSGISGNRAWNNSVRSRLYLTKDGKKDEGDKNVRWLKTVKANYGPSGGRIKLRWTQGVFIRDEPEYYRDFSDARDDLAF